jgi:hypothetical protein
MSIRETLAGVCALLMLSCSGDVDSPDVPDQDDDPTAQAGSQETQAHRRRRRTSFATAPSSGSVQTRQTSDGETIRVIVPEPAPTQEVPPGAPCGVVDSNGVVLSCAPGSYCLSPGDGLPGQCVAAPRAPRTDG